MATFHIDRDSNFAFNIAQGGHTYILDPDVSIVVEGNPMIVAASAPNTTLQIKGQLIAGSNFSGLLSLADSADIKVERNGAVMGHNAVQLLGQGVELSNHGLLEGRSSGLLANSQTTSIANDGQILGGQFGILLGESSERQSYTLNNNGLIQGDVGIHTSAANGVIVLEEDSRVVGDSYAIRAFTQQGGSTTVTNHGFIKTGEVVAYNGWTGTDTFTNYGLVRGHIMLEGGDDVFVERDGKVIGAIEGGMGDDTFTVLSAKTRVHERAGEGDDTVRSSVSFSLETKGEIETLILTGRNNISGFGGETGNLIRGNAANNKIDGGLGEDMLTGGAGRDTFMFGYDLRNDYITDFANNTDKIRIYNWSGYDSFDDLDMSQVGANVEIVFVDDEFSEAIIVENTRLRQLDASDFIFG
jgi:Ca2+-binding RTX toxin-like protein